MKEFETLNCAKLFLQLLVGLLSLMWIAPVTLSLVSTAMSQTAGAVSSIDIVRKLQTGGYILYIRHAATNHAQFDTDLSDLTQCQLQRNLSAQGKKETKILKAALSKLNIEIGEVYTSPYCRCVDTAKIGFENYQIDQNLRATFYTDQAETKALATHLNTMLSTVPRKGTNTVLIGHTANLRELTKLWPKPEGVALIFKPLGNDGFEHIGQIIPSEWASLAGLK